MGLGMAGSLGKTEARPRALLAALPDKKQMLDGSDDGGRQCQRFSWMFIWIFMEF